MRHLRHVLLLLACGAGLEAGGCGGGPAPSAATAPLALLSTNEVAPDPCEVARTGRARVPALLAEGRLDRAARVLERAATTCPADAPAGWTVRLSTLAELGRWDDVRAIVAAVEQSADAPQEAKDAAAAASARAAAEDVRFAEDDAAKTPMRAAYAEASAKLQAGDVEGAYAGFLRARELWHPNGQALAQAGLAALKLGRRPDAQRLFDRAIVDLERATGASLALDVANGFHAPVRDVAWSSKGRIAIAYGSSVSILAQSTRREVVRVDAPSTVTAIAFAPDGATLAAGTERGEVRLWDVASGAPRGALLAPTSAPTGRDVASLAFSPSGAEISVVMGGEIWSWDVASKAVLRHLGAAAGDPAAAHVVAYSADGKYLGAGSDVGAVGLWDAATGERVRTLAFLKAGAATERRVHSIGFARVGDVAVVVVASDGHMEAYALASGERVAEGDGATAVVVSHDGRTVATSDAFGVFTVSDAKRTSGRALESGVDFRALSVKPRRARASARTFERAAFSPDDAHLVTSSIEGGVRMWRVATGESIAALDGDAVAVTALAAGPDVLVSGAKDGRVQAWDLARGVAGPSLTGFRDEIFGVALSRDRSRVAAVGRDDALRVWDAGTRAVIQHVGRASHAPSTVAFSPDGSVVTTLWERYDVKDGFKIADNRSCATPRQSGLPAAIQFSPTGELACTAESTIYFFGTEENGARLALVGHSSDVVDLAFSSDGRGLVSGSGDGKVLLWDLPAARLRPDTVVPTRTLEGHAGPVVAVAYAPDGRAVASGSEDGTARVWSVETGASIAVVSDHRSPVRALAFTSNGAFLASGADDGMLLLSRASDGSQAVGLATVSGVDAAMAITPDGHVEFFGVDADKARERVLCRVGSVAFELEVCRERFETAGLLAKVLVGDATYADP